MKRKTNVKLSIITLMLFYILLFPRPVYAYLDPGSGSLIIQILIATLAGLAFTIKIYWKKIRAFLGKLFSKNFAEKDDEE